MPKDHLEHRPFPSRPTISSPLPIRITAHVDQSSTDRQLFYITSRSPRDGSPLLSAKTPRDDPPPVPRLDTTLACISPAHPSPYALSPNHPSRAAARSPSSPNRSRGTAGDKDFDSIKEAATKHALLEKSTEQADVRARDEGHPVTVTMSAPRTDRSVSPLPAATSRPALAGLRTSSIESTNNSAATSPSQSNLQSQLTMDSPDAVDVPALIAAAGSPEAAIRKLLQDKYATAQNNAQLWRLMNKQRAMMTDLNKDLQKALKDKERFRKKLKEQLQTSASLSTVNGRVSAMTDRDESSVGTPAEERDDSDRDVGAPVVKDTPVESIAPSVKLPLHATPLPPPFPPEVRFPQRSTSVTGPSHRIPTGAPETLVKIPERNLAPRSPSEKVASSKPVSFSTPSKDRVQSMSRKGPPAPLDLSPQKHIPAAEISSSEYTGDSMHPFTPGRSYESGQLADSGSPLRGRTPYVGKPSTDELTPLSESGYSSPEEPGSPHVAQVQTYQSLNALNAVIKTPHSADGGVSIQSSTSSPRLQSAPPAQTAVSPIALPATGGFDRQKSTRQPVPPTPSSVASSHMRQARQYADIPQEEPETTTSEYFTSHTEPGSPQSSAPTLFPGAVSSPGQIFQGFVSPEWPGLLLPPSSLPAITVKVDSSRLRPSRYATAGSKQAEDSPVFSLSIRSSTSNAPLWRVEKTLHALSLLDSQIKAIIKFKARLPDRMLFVGHAPARIDARRAALETYFARLLEVKLSNQAANVLCTFLTLDSYSVDESESQSVPSSSGGTNEAGRARPRKEGYLTKKGKNFGGWKARYFVLDSDTLKYYEGLGGSLLGSIKLQYASIGRQTGNTQEDVDEENQFRHAFLIMEPKRKDRSSHTKHVLCAENDEERDSWIQCLLRYVEAEQAPPSTAKSLPERNGLGPLGPDSPRSQKSMVDLKKQPIETKQPPPPPPVLPELRSVMYDATVAADAPKMVSSAVATPAATNTPDPLEAEAKVEPPHPIISGPSKGAKIQDASAWGSKREPNVLVKNNPRRPQEPEKDKHKERKRSIFAFSGRVSTESTSKDAIVQKDDSNARLVFGIPLADAVEQAFPLGVTSQLPIVVHRCLEYLKARNAVNEEGIFRVSGSNVVVRQLRDRFDTDGDVKLFPNGDETYDVHAIASLLKLYCRELPASILTRELHLDFARCGELDEQARAQACNVLVNRLPTPNRELLDHLMGFLAEIVANERVNKMNVRNVGIVFAPTLNIPAPLVSTFVTGHAAIFGPPLQDADVEETIRDFLDSLPSSASSRSLQLNTDLTQTPNKSRPQSRDPPTPSSDGHFASPFGKTTDYMTMQRMAKDAYDIGYTPTGSQSFSRGASVSHTDEPASPAANPAHTSFHSMQFPDPPLTSRSARFPHNVMSRASPTVGTISSHSSTGTLSPVIRQASVANTIGSQHSNSNTSSGEREDGSASSNDSPRIPYSSTFASLNDINISSSPLMGGTSPEFNRSSTGFGPHGSIYGSSSIGAASALANAWAPVAGSNLSTSQSAASIPTPVSGTFGPAPTTTTTKATYVHAPSASATVARPPAAQHPQHSTSASTSRSISNPSWLDRQHDQSSNSMPPPSRHPVVSRSISSGNTPLVTNLEHNYSRFDPPLLGPGGVSNSTGPSSAGGYLSSSFGGNGGGGFDLRDRDGDRASGYAQPESRAHAAMATGPHSATEQSFGRRLLRRQSGQLLGRGGAGEGVYQPQRWMG